MARARGREGRIAVGIVVASLGILAYLNFWWSTATARLSRYLDVSDVSGEGSVQAELLGRFPVGTPSTDVQAFLERRGLRRDGALNGYRLLDGAGKEAPDLQRTTTIVCEFAYTTASIQFVKESWQVFFRFDGNRKLTSVEASCNLTGL